MKPTKLSATPTVPPDRESGVRLRVDPDPERDERTWLDIARRCQLAALGLEVCAKRAHAAQIVERAAALAVTARELASDASAHVGAGLRRPSMSERMRWEWLASTAALVDGRPEQRLVDEIARELERADDARADALASSVRALGLVAV